jgi:hypothetical protein
MVLLVVHRLRRERKTWLARPFIRLSKKEEPQYRNDDEHENNLGVHSHLLRSSELMMPIVDCGLYGQLRCWRILDRISHQSQTALRDLQ